MVPSQLGLAGFVLKEMLMLNISMLNSVSACIINTLALCLDLDIPTVCVSITDSHTHLTRILQIYSSARCHNQGASASIKRLLSYH